MTVVIILYDKKYNFKIIHKIEDVLMTTTKY